MNLLKRIYPVWVLFILFSGCDQKEKTKDSDGFTVSGKIQGIKGDTVYLYKMERNSMEQVDKAPVAQDGSFSFSGKVTKPEFYRFKYDSAKFVELLIDNERFSFSSDAQSTELPKVKGSPINQDFLSYVQYFNGLVRKRSDLEQQYFRLQMAPVKNQDSIRLLSEQLAEIEPDRDMYTQHFIDSIFPSKAIFFIVSVLNKEPYLEYQADLSRKLLKEYPESPLAKEYNQAMEQILGQRKQMEEKKKNNPIKEGVEAPDISLDDPEGKVITLSSLKGNFVLLDFWASWCRPCRAENPHLVEVFKRYRNKPFKIYSVSLDQSKGAWEKAIQKDQLDMPGWFHVSDLKQWNSSVVPQYQIEGIPFTLLLDKEGKIIATGLRGEELDRKLNEVLN